MFDVSQFRANFPVFDVCLPDGKHFVYVDNSSTSQKPRCVIDSITNFYSSYNSNVDYGMYDFSVRTSEEYDRTRLCVANYFGVNDCEIIFSSGATEGMNLLANSYGRKFLHIGDEILIGSAEHHASYLPWNILSKEIGFTKKLIPLVLPNYCINLDAYESLFTKKTKLVVIQHVGNVLGDINNIKLMSKIAHEHGAKIVIDGAASLIHGPMNLRDIDCDFFVTSGHKGFGPNGSGFIFGKYDLLKDMPPYRVGGRMVEEVSFDYVTYKLPPWRFEAGSPNVASIIGFGETIKFLSKIQWQFAKDYFHKLVSYCKEKLNTVVDIETYGNGEAGVFSFNIKNIHSHDVSTILAKHGIAVRAGNHCAQPLMKILGVNGTTRISLSLYNTREEIDFIVEILISCKKYFL